MSAARYDITIEQGTYWELPLTWKDSTGAVINNAGFAFKFQAKDINGSGLLINLSNGSGISVGGSDGKITLSMSDADTTALTFKIASYNLEYTPPSGKPKRLLKGFITLSKDVSP